MTGSPGQQMTKTLSACSNSSVILSPYWHEDERDVSIKPPYESQAVEQTKGPAYIESHHHQLTEFYAALKRIAKPIETIYDSSNYHCFENKWLLRHFETCKEALTEEDQMPEDEQWAQTNDDEELACEEPTTESHEIVPDHVHNFMYV